MKTLPTQDQVLAWLRDNPRSTHLREIARAFGLKGAERSELKRLLAEMRDAGLIAKDRKRLSVAGELPPVSVLRVIGTDASGDLLGEPVEWAEDGPAPKILLVLNKSEALGPGDRILARISTTDDPDHPHEARVIRRIGAGPNKILGIFRQSDQGGRILPIDKKADREWMVAAGDRAGARDGELVEAEQVGPKSRMGLPKARIIERLGDPGAPKSVSLIAIHEHGIPDSFPDAVLAEAEIARAAALGEREDLRHLNLITIDPSDARDRDDAVTALPDPDPANPGGHILWVAIADVAHYVTPGSALDREARLRGNSSYFPDRVVPMLPEALSGDICSLHQNVDRACLALSMILDAQGNKLSHRFTRGLMRSPAALAYEQAQAAADGTPDEQTEPLVDGVIKPLWSAYAALKSARDRRQPLHLDLPERKIILAEDGTVLSVAFRERFDAHKLIEEFMVLANVCAAETLEEKRQHLLYRVHEEPNPDKLEALREVVASVGLTLAKGQVLKTRHLNQLLDAAAGTDTSEMVNMSVLRSMTQAYYAPQNFGHFGLNLRRYAHFTSPIRRYSDLVVHRALIAAHGWGKDGLSAADIEMLSETAEHISMTERRSMLAERDTNDRYLAAYLADRVGAEFTGTVAGIARFGLFVKLDDSGADGLIPISTLGDEYFRYDEGNQTLTGEKSHKVIGLGMKARVRLAEAVPITGGLLFELLEFDGKAMPARPVGGRRGTPKRALGRSRIKRSKDAKRGRRKH